MTLLTQKVCCLPLSTVLRHFVHLWYDWYSTVQYSAVQCSTVQCSTAQYNEGQYSTVQYRTVQYSTVVEWKEWSLFCHILISFPSVQWPDLTLLLKNNVLTPDCSFFAVLFFSLHLIGNVRRTFLACYNFDDILQFGWVGHSDCQRF